MKITNINAVQNIDKYKQLEKNDQQFGKKAAKKDQISISSEALEMFKNDKDVSKSEKIAALKSDIANNSYKVDPEALADKISYLYSK